MFGFAPTVLPEKVEFSAADRKKSATLSRMKTVVRGRAATSMTV